MFITAGPSTKLFAVLFALDFGLWSVYFAVTYCRGEGYVCVLLLQDLLQSCARGGRRRVEDMCYERRRAEACVDESAHRDIVSYTNSTSSCMNTVHEL